MAEQQQSPEDQAYTERKTDAEKDLESLCNQLRQDIKQAEVMARSLRAHPAMLFPDTYSGQHSEMIAQSMLAVRALEEARMRLGKVLQYAGDGVSIYDKA